MKNIVLAIVLSSTTMASAAELQSVAVIGIPVVGQTEAWQGHVDFVSWIDPNTLIYAGESGFVKCYRIDKKSEVWSRRMEHNIWNLAAGKGNLFLLDEDKTIHILDAATGKTTRALDRKAIAALAESELLIPNGVAWVPKRDIILVNTYSESYGENVLLLDEKSLKRVGRAKSDGFLREIRPTRDGKDILTLSNANNIRLWSIDENRELFKMGEDKVAPIDAPFTSNAVFDGEKVLIYSIDRGRTTGTVHVFDAVANEEVAHFDSRNGHLKMDVDFTASRVALTGTSQSLALVDFSGRILTECKDAADQRVVAVKFSPDGSRLAIGSWDNTVRVWDIDNKASNRPHERD